MYIHPVKSLAGLSVDNATVSTFGLKSDRMMMLVDENGKFITQRQYPQLATIKLSQNDQGYLLETEGKSQLVIDKSIFTNAEQSVEIWGDHCHAFLADAAINSWFSDFLGFKVKLANYDTARPRPVDPNYANPDDMVSFADGFPLLVISQASLEDLNSRLDNPVSMRNFRPNLVISGGEAYQEDNWKQIQIGDVVFDAVKRCSRCVLTTVNPDSGVKDPQGQPLRTLSQYRRATGGVMFGMNLIPRNSGKLSVGESLTVVEQ